MSQRIAIIGSGLIGRAWAMIFARAGWEPRLWDPVEGVAQGALALCAEGLRTLAGHGLCDDPEGAAARITAVATLEEACAGADFVQENGPERLEIKIPLFAQIDAATPPGVPIATSSSAIRISLIAADLPGRARCLVGHPVNPPHLIPLVELSGAEWTSASVIARAREVYESIGQAPITVLKEVEGFILNRLQGALLAEAFRLVSEGYVTPQDLDRSVSDGLGLRWSFLGPLATIELNAPAGIEDYVARFGPFYQRLAAAPPAPEVYGPQALATIMAQWNKAPDLPAAMQWRDRRLAALRAHKKQAEAKE